jgi:DNA invertase Pin-like site-specific DNA recombinase
MAQTPTAKWLSYERLSLVRTDSDLIGIKDQHDTNVREIELRGGVVESYSDAGGHRSGRSDIHRPDWRKVISRLPDPDVAGIIATFQDRISRDVEDTAALIKLCERHNKHLIIPTEGVDTTRTGWTPEVKLVLHIKASVAQHYADETAKKLRKRVRQYHDNGILWGKQPFGMQRIGKGLDTRFTGDENAETAISILSWYASAMSYDTVTEKANASGLRFRDRAGRPCRFGRESVRTIVGNVLFYAGYLPRLGWDAKNDRIELVGQGSYVERYARAGEARRVTSIEPIINDELANAVIERRHANQLAGRRTLTWVPLLTPIAYHAGKRLRADTRDFCHVYRSRGTGIWIDATQADEDIVRRMSNVQFPPEARALIIRNIEARTGDQGRQRAQAEYDDAQVRMDELVSLLLDRKIKREIYDERYIALERIQHRAKADMNRVTDADRAISLLSDLAGVLAEMPPEMRKRNIHRIFERIDFGDDGEISSLHLRAWARAAFGDPAVMGAISAEGGHSAQQWHPDAHWFILKAIAALYAA